MKTMILSCTCQHEFHDKTYGKGKRVMNPTKKGVSNKLLDTAVTFRCTICGKERDAK